MTRRLLVGAALTALVVAVWRAMHVETEDDQFERLYPTG